LWLIVFVTLSPCHLVTLSAHGAEPEVRNLDVRGLQVGGTTTLTIDGDDLGSAPRLLLPFAAKQERKAGGTDKRAAFDVTLAADVPPGYYHLRVATDTGVSLPVIIGVDALPQRPLAATVPALPAALSGAVAGGAAAETKFTGKAGQKVLVEVEAQRLGSKLRPVVHLYGRKRLQVAWGWGRPSLGGDARLEATLPEDGDYTVSVHDAEYAVPGPGFFRVKVGEWSFVDAVFPPVVARGKASVELLGPATPPRLDVDASKGTTVLPLDWPREGTWSGPRPFLVVSSHQEVLEQAAAAKGQELPAGKVGVSGRLLSPFEEDRYRVPVTPRSKVRFEVFAERLGSPLDVALVVRDDKGAELARVDDSPGTLDPILDYVVPDKVTSVTVGVLDAAGRGGPTGVYRLTVEPQAAAGDPGTFHLFTPAQRVAVAVGGWGVVPVLVERRGYEGAITLSAEGLPRGVMLDGATIPAGGDGALVTVRREESAGEAAVTAWRGRGENGQEEAVAFKGHPLERLQPWLAAELPVAPTTDRAAEFVVDWRGLADDAGLVPAGKLALPVKLTRPAGPATVRLTLVTAQPLGPNNQPDPNTALRAEKPVELAANVAEGEVTLLVPPLLPGPSYDVTVRAELVGADKKTVAVAHAPVRRLAVRPSLVVQLEGPAKVEGKLDPKVGVVFALKGKVERREGLTGDVALVVTGLPQGGRADPVTVKADAADFALNVVLPVDAPAGEVKVKLTPSAADPKQPAVRVQGRDVVLNLVVPPPAK
jgi:hypothetical protein